MVVVVGGGGWVVPPTLQVDASRGRLTQLRLHVVNVWEEPRRHARPESKDVVKSHVAVALDHALHCEQRRAGCGVAVHEMGGTSVPDLVEDARVARA